MHILKNTTFDFVRWRWHAIAISWVVILAGVLMLARYGVPLGVEFSGGTIVYVKFDQQPDLQQVRTAVETSLPGVGQNALVQGYGDPSANQVMVRVPDVGAETGGNLSQAADAVEKALKSANLSNPRVVGTDIVGPSVGRQLTRQGILATGVALTGILLYVALRFRLSFAVGAVVATIHDLLITLAFLAFFRYDLSLNVIAALLTITGYSVNDTIVIFDRVRENMSRSRGQTLAQIINASVNQTLGRTIITAGLTLLSVLALFFFGGEVLHGFAFTMLIGIVTGTYSSVFIAAGIVLIWQGRQQVTGAAGRPATASVTAPVPARKPTRRRAS
ncbi:MAG: protein translocase subunit SecF [Vicinamibacterales bacterium]